MNRYRITWRCSPVGPTSVEASRYTIEGQLVTFRGAHDVQFETFQQVDILRISLTDWEQ